MTDEGARIARLVDELPPRDRKYLLHFAEIMVQLRSPTKKRGRAKGSPDPELVARLAERHARRITPR